MQKELNGVQKVESKLTEIKVGKAQVNEMVDRGESNNILIQRLKESANHKNTQQSPNNWINVLKSWASENHFDKINVLKSMNQRR